MAFWNRKKKRTTAKPKINASVPKPKVNSEKQESSIPPQPKNCLLYTSDAADEL